MKKTKTSGGALIGGIGGKPKTTTTSFQQTISVKNTRLSPLHRLIVKDRLHVSEDAHVKVNVTEPAELRTDPNQTPGALQRLTQKNRVRARWAVRSDDLALDIEEEAGDPSQGFVEWVCELSASANLDVKLAWEIVTPAGVEWD